MFKKTSQPHQAEKLSPQNRETTRKIIDILKTKDYDNVLELIQKTSLPPEALARPDMQRAALEGMKKWVAEGWIDRAKKIQSAFSTPPEALARPDMQQAALEGMKKSLAEGLIARAKEMQAAFSINEKKAQQAALEGMKKLLADCWIDWAKKIQAAFSIPPEVLSSPDLQQAALEGMKKLLAEGLIDRAKKIQTAFSIPPKVLADPDMRQAALEGTKKSLAAGSIDRAKEIQAAFNLDKNELAPIVREMALNNNILALSLPDELRNCLTAKEQNSAYSALTQGEEIDETIKSWFAFLHQTLGLKKTKQIFIGRENFWKNPHDQLLFVERLIKLPPDEQTALIALLAPLLDQTTDLEELNNNLGYFSLAVYKEKNHGSLPPFRNFDHFVREANLQRYNITIPEEASPKLREAIEHLTGVQGVDVPFLRKLCQICKTGQGEGFPLKIYRIIEGEDKINERKLIPPMDWEVELDTLGKISANAIGFWKLNKLTPRFRTELDNPNTLGAILKLLDWRDQENKRRIERERDKQISFDPADRNHYLTEAQQRIKKESLLVKKDKGEFSAINVGAIENLAYRLDEEQLELVRQALQVAIYENHDFRTALASALKELFLKKETLDNVFDLVYFSDLIPIGQEIQEKIRDNQEISPSDLYALLQGKEVPAVLFTLWLALNNQKRAQSSKNLKKKLDGILNQQRYQRLVQKFKLNQQLQPRDNSTLAFLKGKLVPEEDDAKAIGNILKEFGFASGRKLEVRIAAGDDYTAWTCGDQTNCCMPFTSHKNQEYLLRNDTAYFIVELDGRIIAQSVLVEAKDKSDHHRVIAIDNIEIANRAIGHRPAIAKAYQELKDKLTAYYQEKYPGERLEIIIGTSYNDDGGTVTAACPLVPLNSQPLKGQLSYSDCFDRSSAYLFYDSEKQETGTEKYFGLQIDMFDKSLIHKLASSSEEIEEARGLLKKIGKGEDDGDGGLIFPDNYSCVIVDSEPVGYIIAADYITEEDEADYVTIEKIAFAPELTESEKERYFRHYLQRKNFDGNDNIDGVKISKAALADFPPAKEILTELIPDKEIIEASLSV